MRNGNTFMGDNKGITIANESGTVIVGNKNSEIVVPHDSLCKAVKIKKTDQFFKREWITIFAEVLTIITGLAGIIKFNIKGEWIIIILVFTILLLNLVLCQYKKLEQIKYKKSFNYNETALIERQGYIYAVYPKKCPKCGEKAGGKLKFVRQTDEKWILQCNVQPQHEFEYDHTEVVFEDDEN